jgi:hypothetical protein
LRIVGPRSRRSQITLDNPRKRYDRPVGPHRYRSRTLCHTAEMKPLRCLLHMHVWHTYHNDEGERYQLCTRCGAYREKYTLTDYRAGSA